MKHPDEADAIDILMVEDNPADVDLMREALRECRIRNRLSIVENGLDALVYLRQPGPDKPAPPQLIILDLHLPKKDGKAVLSEIKRDPDLKRIPTIILTTSRSEADIFQCYNAHANCYIAKPLELDDFFGVVRKIEEFWLGTAELPRG